MGILWYLVGIMKIYMNLWEFIGFYGNLLEYFWIYGNFTKEFVKENTYGNLWEYLWIYGNFTKEFVKKNTQKTHIKLIFVCSTKIFSVFRKINFCHVSPP